MHVSFLCWGCYRCSGHKAVLVTTSDSTNYIFHWHPLQIRVLALEVKWLRNFSTSAPYKLENHSGKRRRGAEGRLGNNKTQWVTVRHSLSSNEKFTHDYVQKDWWQYTEIQQRIQSAEGNKAIKLPEKEAFSSFWKKRRTPTQFFIFICFTFHMSGKLPWQYPATAMKSCARVLQDVVFLTGISTITLTDILKIRSSHSYQTLSFILSSTHRARPTLVMWNLSSLQ